MRLLVDAGADTASAIQVSDAKGEIKLDGTLLTRFTITMLRQKKMCGINATEDQLYRLEGVRRVLLRVGAVHAVSFLWPIGISSTYCRVCATSPSLRMMQPILKRRARRSRVPLAGLFYAT